MTLSQSKVIVMHTISSLVCTTVKKKTNKKTLNLISAPSPPLFPQPVSRLRSLPRVLK